MVALVLVLLTQVNLKDYITVIEILKYSGYVPGANGYCPTDVNDENSPLDPDNQNCNNNERRRPLAMCNFDCPGGKY